MSVAPQTPPTTPGSAYACEMGERVMPVVNQEKECGGKAEATRSKRKEMTVISTSTSRQSRILPRQFISIPYSSSSLRLKPSWPLWFQNWGWPWPPLLAPLPPDCTPGLRLCGLSVPFWLTLRGSPMALV